MVAKCEPDFSAVMRYAVSPPLPLDKLSVACDQAHAQGWETVSTMIVGAIQWTGGLINTAGQRTAAPAVCILCRKWVDASLVDIPYPDITL